MSLQIDVVPCNIPAVSIPYQQFRVGDAESQYLLTINSGTPGYDNLYNSFNYHSGCKFSTYDRDNDNTGGHCVADYRSGWWFNSCLVLNLNGVYGDASGITGSNMRMSYLSDNNLEPIRTITMKIRAIN